MASPDELTTFITSSFRSVWALELLLFLKREGEPIASEDLVAHMRASSSVVENAQRELVSAGLAIVEGNAARYMPVSLQVAELVDQAEELYSVRPDRVRRMIVAAASPGLAAFSSAFRLKD